MFYVLHTQGKNAAVFLDKNDGNFQVLKGLRKNDPRFKFQQIKEVEEGSQTGVLLFKNGSSEPLSLNAPTAPVA